MTQPPHTLNAVCPHCDAVNRIPAARHDEQPQCGRCASPLFPGKPVALGAADWDRFTGRNDLPVLVDFWATWCGPCRAMAPQFEEAARRLAGRVQFAKVDTDAEPDIAGRFAIRSIPTLVLMQGGRELRRTSGAMSAAQLEQWVAAG
jgi:thioredoxin 2